MIRISAPALGVTKAPVSCTCFPTRFSRSSFESLLSKTWVFSARPTLAYSIWFLKALKRDERQYIAQGSAANDRAKLHLGVTLAVRVGVDRWIGGSRFGIGFEHLAVEVDDEAIRDLGRIFADIHIRGQQLSHRAAKADWTSPNGRAFSCMNGSILGDHMSDTTLSALKSDESKKISICPDALAFATSFFFSLQPDRPSTAPAIETATSKFILTVINFTREHPV